MKELTCWLALYVFPGTFGSKSHMQVVLVVIRRAEEIASAMPLMTATMTAMIPLSAISWETTTMTKTMTMMGGTSFPSSHFRLLTI